MTRWEVSIVQVLAIRGMRGMWGKWHLGSDPEQRSPVNFSFDEAVWCPRTADEVMWAMQSYFPEGAVTSAPYAGKTLIPVELRPIYSKKKGSKAKVIPTYDLKFRTDYDRKISEWAMDFMSRSKEAGKPFYIYLPYTQPHIPPIPDPEFTGKTKRGNWADLLTQIDAFTGRILDKLDELGLTNDTIVVWTSDDGGDSTFRTPAMDPDSWGGQWNGFYGPWHGGIATSVESSNRAPCIIRWPGRVPAGKVSNELVHEVDTFHDAATCGGSEGSADRQIEGMDMRDFFLGDAEESGRDTVLCLQGNRLQGVKWRQLKAHRFQQDDTFATWSPYNVPQIHNLSGTHARNTR